jgi:lactose/L-arabinose transport system permease protein
MDRLADRRQVAPYGFLLPAVVLFAVFTVYPVVSSLVMSFQTVTGGRTVWVGLGNYRRLLADPIFWTTLSNTLLILVVQVPVMLALALVLAVLLDTPGLRLRGLFRLVHFMPAVTSLVAYSTIFAMLLNPEAGLVNWVLESLGLGRVNWTRDPFWATVSIVLAITWRWTGYNMVIMLAGLQNIPTELYEAAEIDGAGPVRRFADVTLPLLRPIVLFAAVLSTIGTLQLFAEPYLLTNGGPGHSTMTTGYYIFNVSFQYVEFGYGSALAYVLVLLIATLAWLQFRVLERDVDE